MGSRDLSPGYRRAGGALLRAAAVPLTRVPGWWPSLDDAEGCAAWLAQAWRLPGFAPAVRHASASLADRVDTILAGEAVQAREVRRAASSVVRYVLRAVGRPTPFGLFAGVAPIVIGDRARVRWSDTSASAARVDTQWLAAVVERLEASCELLERLDVVFSNLAVRRGGRLEIPRGPDRVTIRYTPAVREVHDGAGSPIRFGELAGKLLASFPDAGQEKVPALLTSLVRNGFLVTSLRAPLTIVDQLGYLLDRLHQAGAACLPEVAGLFRELHAVHHQLSCHNHSEDRSEQETIRAALTQKMRSLSPAGRTPLTVDLRLGCQIQIPDEVAEEMQRAADLLLRLTRRPTGEPVWRSYHAAFRDRYGTGTLVPVGEVVDPDGGLGYPAGYPGSVWPVPVSGPVERDELLLALAWRAVVDGTGEIVLTEETVRALSAAGDVDHRYAPPHVEIAARIHAVSVAALNRGDFTLTVAPARAAGTLTSRFTTTATGSGLEAVYAAAPTTTEGALAAQMSFPPMYPHAENVCRVPAYLPHVLSLGEHRAGDEQVQLIGVGDLSITATRHRLHLVSMSRRQVVEPEVFHALALQKQPPPLARFLAHLTRAFGATWHEFDWGPHAHRLPWLPRIRAGRSILSPARWRLTPADLADKTAWLPALNQWRHRWGCPDIIELRDADRTLRMDLTEPAHLAHLRTHLARHGEAVLTETVASAAEYGWLDGHAHEVAIPLSRTGPPAPPVPTEAMPLVSNHHPSHLPAAPGSVWLYAKLHTHPARLNDIIAAHLPRLMSTLDGEPEWWFVRYRSPAETDHLRLRIHTPDQRRRAAHLAAVGTWAQHLLSEGVIGRAVFDTYQPEIGRYGSGEAMRAAEAVFAADSHTVSAALRLLPASMVHSAALVAIGMVEIAEAFLGSRAEAVSWLIDHPTPTPAALDRGVSDQVVRWAISGTLSNRTSWPPAVAEAIRTRAAALATYRQRLPHHLDSDAVLTSLLHLHHNRAAGIDPSGEAVCRRLARQGALAWRAHQPGNNT